MKYTLNTYRSINYIREVDDNFTYSTAFKGIVAYQKDKSEPIPLDLLEDPILGELLTANVPQDVWKTLHSLIFLHYSTSLHERKFVIVYHSNFYGNHYHKEITDIDKGRYLQKLLTLTEGVHIYNCTPFTTNGTYLTDYLLDYYEPREEVVNYKVEVDGHYLEPNDTIKITNIHGQERFLEKHFQDWRFDREDLLLLGVHEIEIKLNEGLGQTNEVGSFKFLDNKGEEIPVWYINYAKSNIDNVPLPFEEARRIRVVILKKLYRKLDIHLSNYTMPTLDLALLLYLCKNGDVKIAQAVN